MATDTMPAEGMRQLQLRHAEAREDVALQTMALRGGCGSLEAYADACKQEISFRLMIEKLGGKTLATPAEERRGDPGHWKREVSLVAAAVGLVVEMPASNLRDC